jgi:cobalamin biosynthesis protein CobT
MYAVDTGAQLMQDSIEERKRDSEGNDILERPQEEDDDVAEEVPGEAESLAPSSSEPEDEEQVILPLDGGDPESEHGTKG